MDHEECIHGLQSFACAICLHGLEALTEPPKAKRKPRQKKPKRDPVAKRITEIVTGKWAMCCDTPIHRGFCRCQRERRYEANRDMLKEWLNCVPEEHRGMAATAALSTLSAEVTRSGIGPIPVGAETIRSIDIAGLMGRTELLGKVKGKSRLGRAKTDEVIVPA